MNSELKQIAEAIKNGDKTLARQLLTPLMKNNPSADVWYLASKVATSQNQTIKFLEQALELDPFHKWANIDHEKLQRKDSIDSDLEKYKQAQIFYNRGLKYHEIGNSLLALENYSKAISIYPNHSDAYYQRSAIKYEHLDLQGTLDDYETAIKINPQLKNINPKRYALCYFSKAQIYASEMKVTEAIDLFTKCIELNNNFAPAYINRGWIFYLDLDPNVKSHSTIVEKALSDIEEGVRLNPKLSSGYDYHFRILYFSKLDYPNLVSLPQNRNEKYFSENDGGEFYFLSGQKRLAAKKFQRENQNQADSQDNTFLATIYDFNKAIKQNPTYANVYSERGNVYWEIQDFDKAISDWEVATNLGLDCTSELAEAYRVRGTISLTNQKYEDAIKDYTNFLNYYPSNGKIYLLRGICNFLLFLSFSDSVKFTKFIEDINNAHNFINCFGNNHTNSIDLFNKLQYAVDNFARANHEEKQQRLREVLISIEPLMQNVTLNFFS